MSGGTVPGRKAFAIAGVAVRRFARDRTNLFFAFVFPIALILVIGLQFGGDPDPRLGVVDGDGAVARAVLDELGDDVTLVEVDRDDLAGRVESSDLDAGVIFPDGLDDVVAVAKAGEAPAATDGADSADGAAAGPDGAPVDVGFVAGNTTAGQQLRTAVDQALADALVRAQAVQAAVAAGADPAAAAASADAQAATADRISVRTVTAGDRLFPEDTAGADVAAPSQLVLFVFLTGLTGSAALIEARQIGVATRMMATPTSVRAIIAGEALGRLVIGIVQAVYILLATMLLFGVDWGDPLGAAAVVVAVSAVSAGAAMCFGTFFANAEQASGIGTVVALALAALGGAMMPIELFSDALLNVARLTPHYWAIGAFAELVRHNGSLLDIGPQLGVLTGFAAVLLLVASWRMRRVLTRA